MVSAKVHTKAIDGLIQDVLRGALSEAQARQLSEQSPETVVLALLAASRRIAELHGQRNGQDPSLSTPSGMVPVYAKPNTSKGRKKPGGKLGHPSHQ